MNQPAGRKLGLGLPLTVYPSDREQREPFIKSVELCLGGRVVGELYVHSVKWKSQTNPRTAMQQAGMILKAIRSAK